MKPLEMSEPIPSKDKTKGKDVGTDEMQSTKTLGFSESIYDMDSKL